MENDVAAQGSLQLLKCTTCPLQKLQKCSLSIVQSTVCIISASPTIDTFNSGELIAGPGGRLFWGIVRQVQQNLGITQEMSKPFAQTVALMCPIASTSKPDMTAIEACRARLIQDINLSGADYVLTLGALAYVAVTGDVKSSISKIQGQPREFIIGDKKRTVIPAYHPGILLHKPTELENFVRSVRQATEALYAQFMHKHPGDTNWRTLNTEEQIDEFHQQMLDTKTVLLDCDIETSGLTYTSDYILCIGISYAKNESVVIPQEMVKTAATKRLLEDPVFHYIWHDGKFDINFLRYNGIDARVDDDTILLHYALNEVPGTHGLELLSAQLLGADNYKQALKGNLDNPKDSYANLQKDVLLKYQAQDVDYGLQVYHLLYPQVQADPKLAWMYQNILIPAQNFLSSVERYGVYTYLDRLQAMDVQLQDQILKARTEIAELTKNLWNPEEYVEATDAKSMPDEFNPSSPKQVAWLIYTKLHCRPTIVKTMNKLPDTGEATLQSIENKPPIVEKLLELRKLQKLHSTYVVSLLEKRDLRGRIHSTYSLYGTTTGRLASKHPNLQNIPRDKSIKTMLGAPEGRLLLECDYKSAELRALALYSNDEFLIKVFKENLDLHDETALAMFGPGFTKDQRVQAKMINFGIMYGRGAKTISEACHITINEAQDSINKWLARMPRAAAYLKSRRDAIRSGCVLVTPFGRKRRFPLVSHVNLNMFQNEACNFAIQSIASDFTLMTGIRLQPVLAQYDASIVNLVHDSLLIELPQDREIATLLYDLCKKEMKATPRMFFKTLPFDFEADAEIGRYWGDLYETVAECFTALTPATAAKEAE